MIDLIVIDIERKGLRDKTVGRRVECDDGEAECVAGERRKCTAKRVSDHIEVGVGVHSLNGPRHRLLVSVETKGYEQ